MQSLHGDREQCDREQALDDFKKGRFGPKLGLNKPVLLRLIICRTFSVVLCLCYHRNERIRALHDCVYPVNLTNIHKRNSKQKMIALKEKNKNG